MSVNTTLTPVEGRQPVEKTRYKPPPERFVPGQDGFLLSNFATCRVQAVVEPVAVGPRLPRRRFRVEWYELGVIALMLLAAVVSAACLLSAAPLPD